MKAPNLWGKTLKKREAIWGSNDHVTLAGMWLLKWGDVPTLGLSEDEEVDKVVNRTL